MLDIEKRRTRRFSSTLIYRGWEALKYVEIEEV